MAGIKKIRKPVNPPIPSGTRRWVGYTAIRLLVITAGIIFLAGSSRAITDSDGDLVSDEWEIRYGFDPKVKNVWTDSDHDGLTDLVEFQLFQQYNLALDPHDPDSDDDGLPDGAEICIDFDCKTYTPGKDTNPDNPDSDFDGIPDGMEVGFVKGERIIGSLTDPTDADTDDDGVDDGLEYSLGNDPNRPDNSSFYQVSPPVAQVGWKISLHGKKFGDDPCNLCTIMVNGISVRPDPGSDRWTIKFRVPEGAELHSWSGHQIQVVCMVNGFPYFGVSDQSLIITDPLKNEFPHNEGRNTIPVDPTRSKTTYYGFIENDHDRDNIVLPLNEGRNVTISAESIDPKTGRAINSEGEFDLELELVYFQGAPLQKAGDRSRTNRNPTTIKAPLEPGEYRIILSTKTSASGFFRAEIVVEK